MGSTRGGGDDVGDGYRLAVTTRNLDMHLENRGKNP